MPNKSEIERISRDIFEADLDKILRPSLGKISLIENQKGLEYVVDRVKEGYNNSEYIPKETFPKYYDVLHKLSSLFREIYNTEQTQFINEREEISTRLKTVIEEFKSVWISAGFLILENKINNKEILRSQEESIKSIIDKLNISVEDVEKTKQNLTESLESFKKRYDPIVVKAEILSNVQQFSSHAKSQKKESYFWLVAILASIIGFVLCLTLLNYIFPIDLSWKTLTPSDKDTVSKFANYAIAKNIGARILFMSIISAILGFTVKNYNNCMHNFTINLHKANSLFAALQLIDKAKTPEGNDNLIIQASNAIFSHQPTGYNKKGPENVPIGMIDHIKDLVQPNSENK